LFPSESRRGPDYFGWLKTLLIGLPKR
jgi:hypothetical protein